MFKKILLSIVLIITFLFSFQSQLFGQTNTTGNLSDKPSAPLKVELYFSSEPVLNQYTTLNFKVTLLQDAPNTSIKFDLPKDGFIPLSGNRELTESLLNGETKIYQAEVLPVSFGQYKITASAVSTNGTYVFGKTAELYVSLDEEGTKVSQTNIFAGETTTKLESEKISDISQELIHIPLNDKPNQIQNPFGVEVPGPGQIAVRGFWYYRDKNGVDRVLRDARVEVWDLDTFSSDDLLSTIYTDNTGYYESGNIPNTGDEAGGQDIYVKVFSTDDFSVRVTDFSNILYSSQTPTISNVPDGYVDVGSRSITDANSRMAYYIYDKIANDAYDYLRDNVGWVNSYNLQVKWSPTSTASTLYHSGGSIDLIAGDRWDIDVFFHEYGHFAMYKIYGNILPSAPNCVMHMWGVHSSLGCAWVEGWANFLQAAIQNDRFYDDTEDQTLTIDYEPPTGIANGVPIPVAHHPEDEGAVAASLWDIFDTGAEPWDSLSNGINGSSNSGIWKIVSVNRPNDAVQFYNSWSSSTNGFNPQVTSILQHHEVIPVTSLPPPNLVAPGTTTAPGSSIATLTPTFQWQSVAGADGYALYVSKFNGVGYDTVFNSQTDVGQPVTGLSYVLPAGRLVNGGQYRWNMSSHNSSGYGSENINRNYFNVSLTNCTYSINPSSGNFSASGGSSSTVVTTSTGCTWTASSNVSWISVTSGSNGNGTGTVAFSVQANTGVARTGAITINGQTTYTVNQVAGSVNCPPPTTISIGQTVNGSLANGDCSLPDGSYYDAYTFSGTAGQQIFISMDSTQFDTYLYLYQGSYPGGTFLAGSNSGGVGTNARIPATPGAFYQLLTTGTYTILANSNLGGEIGNYSLTLGTNNAGSGTVQFSSSSYSVNENGGSAVITVTRTGGSSAFVINCGTSNGTATAGQDYIGFDTVLNFATNETSKTVNISIIDDNLLEGNETVNLILSNPSGGVTLGSPSTSVLTILDNDVQPSISIDDITLNEGNSGTSNFVLNVNLSQPSNQTITVNYATSDGTANSGTDYQFRSGTLTFIPNDTTEAIFIPVNGDTQVEPNETFFVNLSNPTNATFTDSQGLGTIINDDSNCTPPYSINPMSQNFSAIGGNGTVQVTAPSGCVWTAVSNSFAGFGNNTFTSNIFDLAQDYILPDLLQTGFGKTLPANTGERTATAESNVVATPAFTEDFDNIGTLPGIGWFLQNNSVPVGTTGWFQGTTTFPAQSGAATSWIGANFNNTTGTNTISNWLLTPNITFNNGDTVTFYTRTVTGNTFPDRLQVRMSTNGTSTNVGTGAVGVGDFTALLLDINPTYMTGGVYPEVWTPYTVTISGLGSPTSGRLAFRYFVENGGPGGANSNIIGIDSFSYNPTSVSNWITVTSGSNGNGTGTVGFSVQANTGAARTGTITIAGQPYTVNQVAGTGNTIPVTVQTNPAGRSFIVDGVTYTSSQPFNWLVGESHTIGTTLLQNIAPGTRYQWQNWNGGTGSMVQIVMPTSATTYTANFVLAHQLITNASPSNGGIVSPTNDFWYSASQPQQISATPNSGYTFSGWTGTGNGSYSGTNNPASITINGPITQTANFTQIVTTSRKLFDFDGDGKADVSVYRPSTNIWYRLLSGNSGLLQNNFGSAGDIPTPADFDGDGKTDLAIFRPSSGTFWYQSSITNAQIANQWGQNGDIPRPSDFDGDGKADFIIFRPSENNWYRLGSTGLVSTKNFGSVGDKPVTGDFDGDGKSDVAIFRPSSGDWWYQSSINNAQLATHFGASADVPSPADFDGDGKTDFAVFRPSTGVWYILNSSTGLATIVQFGIAEDKPIAADYDGDGKADIAVFRPSTGIWYLLRSTSGFTGLQFGVSTDVPLPNSFVP